MEVNTGTIYLEAGINGRYFALTKNTVHCSCVCLKKLKANETIIVTDFQRKTLEAFGKGESAMVMCSTT